MGNMQNVVNGRTLLVITTAEALLNLLSFFSPLFFILAELAVHQQWKNIRQRTSMNYFLHVSHCCVDLHSGLYP